MSTQSAVSLRAVTARRGRRTVWADATFDVPTGSFTAVIGRNGSGKTTLVRIVLGLLRPASGTVQVFGSPARRGNPAIGLVPQTRTLFNATEVRCRDLVALGGLGTRWGFSMRGGPTDQAIESALASVGAAEFADLRLGETSGGQQRRISIAAALITRPRLLILDEPLAGLDLAGQVDLVELVHRINHDKGVTVLFVTHDLNPVLDHIDSAVYIAEGQPRLASADEITDPALLSSLYGTPVQVARTPDGCVFTRAE